MAGAGATSASRAEEVVAVVAVATAEVGAVVVAGAEGAPWPSSSRAAEEEGAEQEDSGVGAGLPGEDVGPEEEASGVGAGVGAEAGAGDACPGEC